MSFKLQLLVFALAMTGLIYFASAQTAYPTACGDEQMQERTRVLMLQGADEAFSDQIAALYGVWVRDESGQPGRAKSGTDQAISAYVRARRSIETWKLAPC